MFLVQKWRETFTSFSQMWKSVSMAYITFSIVYVVDVMCEMFLFIFWPFGWNQMVNSILYFIFITIIDVILGVLLSDFRNAQIDSKTELVLCAFLFSFDSYGPIFIYMDEIIVRNERKSRGPYNFIVRGSIYFESKLISIRKQKNTFIFYVLFCGYLYYYVLRNELCEMNVCAHCTYYRKELNESILIICMHVRHICHM